MRLWQRKNDNRYVALAQAVILHKKQAPDLCALHKRGVRETKFGAA